VPVDEDVNADDVRVPSVPTVEFAVGEAAVLASAAHAARRKERTTMSRTKRAGEWAADRERLCSPRPWFYARSADPECFRSCFPNRWRVLSYVARRLATARKQHTSQLDAHGAMGMSEEEPMFPPQEDTPLRR
jgi:hypothetical protein